MNANTLACAISARASDALASPYALPVYVGARVAAWRWLPAEYITLYLSDFANAVLILMAAEQARQSRKLEREVDELVRATDGADDRLAND